MSDVVAPELKTTPNAMHLIRACDLQLSTPSWLIKDVLEADSLASFVGGYATCKTFLAIAAVCSVATGTDFFGHKVKKGAVIYVCGEGRGGIKRRLSSWERHHGVSLKDAPIFVTSAPASLVDDQGYPLAAACESAGVDPVLIVIDTLARNYGHGDENSSADMGSFIKALDHLRARYRGATVLVVHHAGHADKTRARGSSAFAAALDSAYQIDRDLNGVVSATCSKMKDADPPPPMHFKLSRVDIGLADDEGAPVFGAALEMVAAPAKTEAPPSGKNQKIAIKALRDLYGAHVKNLEAAGRESAEAWVTLDDWRTACVAGGIDRRRLAGVIAALVEGGRVIVEGLHARPSLSAVVSIR